MFELKEKRVVVTGGAGCIGSHVVDQLLEAGVREVVVIDNFDHGRRENLQNALATGRVTIVEGDIRDVQLLNKIFQGIDYCFHLASLKIIQSMAEPRHALEVNVVGTYNILEACVQHKVQKVVLASTASIYGQADTFPTKEAHHPYNNRTLYGALKMADELMMTSFLQMYGLKFNTLRYFNVYGPRMDASGKYTEVLIRWHHLIQKGEQPLIYGDGKQTMDFIYVGDVARATILALTADTCNETFNCASGVETSLESLCRALLRSMNSTLKPKYMPIPADRGKIEVYRRKADVAKAAKLLRFKAQVDLAHGLKMLTQWLDETSKV